MMVSAGLCLTFPSVITGMECAFGVSQNYFDQTCYLVLLKAYVAGNFLFHVILVLTRLR